MARGLNMQLKLSIANEDVARAALAVAKHPQYCHNLLLGKVLEAGALTAQELVDWLNANLDLMGTGQDVWKRYSVGTHVAYFIQRWRGAVKAETPDGQVIVVAA